MTLGYRSITLIKTGNRTLATVVKLEKEKAKSGYVYRPIFKLNTENGEELLHTYGFATDPSDWKIGDKATVSYDLYEPETRVVLTYYGAFGNAVIWLMVSLPLIVLGGGHFVSRLYLKHYLLMPK
ncbi:hypothetical protein GCM10028808_74240 [Spirosoma migulaei]